MPVKFTFPRENDPLTAALLAPRVPQAAPEPVHRGLTPSPLRITAVQSIAERECDIMATRCLDYLKQAVGPDDARTVWMAGQKITDLQQRTLFYSSVIIETEHRLHGGEKHESFDNASIYRWTPVSMEEFICNPYYLDKKKEVYPVVMDALKEVNNGNYIEAVFTGGIGSGKTTAALYTNAYQLYLLSCMRSPHSLFGLDPSSEILFIFQAITKKLAQSVGYDRFRDMIAGSPYFKEKFPFRKDLSSELVFPNRIKVIPVSGSDTAAIGQNVIGGLIDELNYMSVVQNSKQSVDGGTYDQAVAVYNSIARRRKSRFMTSGKLPGVLCLVSSKRYPGQFTDLKEEEALKEKREKGSTTIYIYDKRGWEIKPWAYSGVTFPVFVGDMTRKPRILDDGETLPEDDNRLVMQIPVENRADFETDIINALREVAGVATLARHPYFMETEKVAAAFKPKQRSIFTVDRTDFISTPLGIRKNFYKPHLPRFVHVDLAKSGDSAGLAVGCVDGFVRCKETDRDQSASYMPHYHIDGVLEIAPPRNMEIQFWKIRETIIKLRDLGLPIRWITYDSYESTDSQQLLRQQGFMTGTQSMDILPCKPYDYSKSAVYDGRMAMPNQPKLLKEILQLERDMSTGKIDHPATGSKDCADAWAGVVFGLFMRREVWSLFDIPLSAVPPSVFATAKKMDEKNDRIAAGAAAMAGK